MMSERLKETKCFKLFFFRIYATNDYYYDNDDDKNKIKTIDPVILDNFPDDDWKSTYYLGNVPDHVVEAKYAHDGFRLFGIKLMFNQLDQAKSRKEQLKDCISEIKSKSDLFKRYKWYSTITIENDVNLQESRIVDSEYQLISHATNDFLKREIKKTSPSKIFDKIVYSLMAEIEGDFFTNVLVESHLLIINKNFSIGYPKTHFSANPTLMRKYKIIDHEKIGMLIKNLSSSKDIDSVVYWRLSMLKEKDKWKKFYFGFVCLEILTHKMFNKIFKKDQFDVFMKTNGGYDESIKIPISDVISDDTNRLVLASKFSIIAGVLHPDEYSNDVSNFKKCKDIRDRFSHGNIIASEELPLSELNSLLEFYTREMLRFYS